MADEDEVLFQITRKHLDTGLRGFPVGTCGTSAVDPVQGVSYVGYPIAELYDVEPEAAVYLLFEKHLPSADELAAFKADLRARVGMPSSVVTALKSLPRDGHPMEWFISGLLYLGMTTKTGDYAEDARNLVARSTELVAAIFRIRNGWGEPIAPDPSLGLIEDFVRMLGIPGADPERVTAVLRSFYVLHMDHGGGNLSTFVGKAVASGHADLYASLAGAMAALYGPLHGRANQDALDFVRRVGTDDPDAVEAFVRKTLDEGGKIYGFGHAVLRAEDPRATVQYEVGRRTCPDDPLFRTALVLRERAVKVLSGIDKVSNPYPNVDAVSGTLLHAVGLTDSSTYTVLFGLSRVVGIAAQIIDERVRARGGKGVAIYRPKFIAANQPRRSLKG
ncbi:MAG: citrate (Si)-synthase [Alphaproteobacteria bacterium]|nr:citrate (Si)-synthase [Alphaproteobacteria bacterium]